MGKFLRAILSPLFGGDPLNHPADVALVDDVHFAWRDFPDPQIPGKRVHMCDLPDGSYFVVQEVSAPEPERGHIGWQLMDKDGNPVEMRNGFYEIDKAKTHAEDHFRTCYITED